MVLSVKINAKDAIKGLDRVKSNLKNSLFVALVRSTTLARETVIKHIDQGQKENLGWPKFAPSTIARKSRLGRSLSGLVDKGRMRTSIHEEINKSRLEGSVFPGVNYLIHHEKGTRRMPKRPIFAPVPSKINNNIEDIFRSEIARGL